MTKIFKETIRGSAFTKEDTECTGQQLSTILTEIRDLTQSYCWYVVDILAPGQQVIELFGEQGNKQIPLNIGSTEDLIAFVSPITQFESGLFLAVNKKSKDAISWNPDEFDTEDLEHIEPAALLIRAFDTSYFEISSKENAIIDRLVNKFKKIHM